LAADHSERREEVKKQLEEKKEEWRQHGHEIATKWGVEQTKRNHQALDEKHLEHAQAGQLVRNESQQTMHQIDVNRADILDTKRSIVHGVKKETGGTAQAAHTYIWGQKKQAANEIKSNEKEWKDMSAAERAAYEKHAADNHKQIDATKVKIEKVRQGQIEKNREVVSTERELKQKHQEKILAKQVTAEMAKRTARDVIFSSRFASPEQVKMMRDGIKAITSSPEKLEELAIKHGVIKSSPPKQTDMPGSPYRVAKSSSRSPLRSGSPSNATS